MRRLRLLERCLSVVHGRSDCELGGAFGSCDHGWQPGYCHRKSHDLEWRGTVKSLKQYIRSPRQFPGEVNAVYQTLKQPLRLGMDQDAFHFLAQEPSSIPGWLKSGPPSMAGLVSLGPLPGFVEASLPIKAFTVVASSSSHSPVIIDQSVVPSTSLQAMTRSQGQHEIPHTIQDIAASIAQAHHLVRGDNSAVRDKSRGSVSSGLPGYVLVHENVSGLVINALESTLPGQFRPHVQDLAAAEDILASSSLDYLPVFIVRSLDHAMDTVNNRLPGSAAAYVFGQERFGAYAAQNTRQRVVCINDVPQRLAGECGAGV